MDLDCWIAGIMDYWKKWELIWSALMLPRQK